MQPSPFLPSTFIVIVLALSPIEVVTGSSVGQWPATIPSTAEAEVRQAVDAFFDTMADHNWEKFRLGFSEDATFFAPGPNPQSAKRVHGRDEVAAVFERQLQNAPRESVRSTRQDPLIQMLGDTAVVTLQWSDRRMNRRTLVLQRQQGKWLIVHIHASVVTEQ
jgi:uncharacterized protein (TIGR02246 family)